MMEQQHKEGMKTLIGQIEKQFSEFQKGLVLAQRNQLMLDQKLNLALQTIELLKSGLEQKGILTQEDLDGIMTKYLEDQRKAREILGDDTLTEEKKIEQLQENANLTEKEAHGIIKAYNDAVAAAQEAGTTFIGADGKDNSGGLEAQGPDGRGNPSDRQSAQSGETAPDSRIIKP
jgi:hypothetical protein